MIPLFRSEVTTHNARSYAGAVMVPTPLPLWFLSALTLIVLVAIVSYFWLGHYTRKVTVEGYLLPTKGLVQLYAPQQGIVSERAVEQGAKVKVGEALLVISVPRSSTSEANVITESGKGYVARSTCGTAGLHI